MYKASDRHELENIRSFNEKSSKFVQDAIDGSEYKCENLRTSVSGVTVGLQAVIGEISKDDDKVLVVYCLVDGLDSAQWKDDEDKPSKWQTVRLLCQSMRAGIPIVQLYDAITKVIIDNVGPIVPSDMVRLYNTYKTLGRYKTLR